MEPAPPPAPTGPGSCTRFIKMTQHLVNILVSVFKLGSFQFRISISTNCNTVSAYSYLTCYL